MKKLTSLLLSLVLMVSVLACGASAKTSTKVRIAGLKGPTTMGLVNLLSMEKDGTASLDYDLQLYGAADEIVPKLIKGELDMAAIPANLAATLYQKTNGGIQVMAVNTLGVLYVVEKGNTVHSFADLKGRTILSTGKGTTPEYVLRYLLKKNGLDPDKDVKIEYYSEASEVTAQPRGQLFGLEGHEVRRSKEHEGVDELSRCAPPHQRRQHLKRGAGRAGDREAGTDGQIDQHSEHLCETGMDPPGQRRQTARPGHCCHARDGH